MQKILLLTLFFLFGLICASAQIQTFEFNGLAGSEVSSNSNYNDPNLSIATITRGSGLVATNNGNRFNANNWAPTSIINAVTGNDYMEFTINPNSGYSFNITTITLNVQRSGSGIRGLALRSSLDTYTTNIDGEKAIADNTSTQVITYTVNSINNAIPVTLRFYGWAEGTGGTGGFEGTGNDIIVNGSVYLNTPQPEINITGNGATITNNDATPQASDFTDFGDIDITSGSQINPFIIENSGTAPLLLNGSPLVAISGTNSADFVVSTLPVTPVANGTNTTFSITFNPNGVGLRTARVSISNTDGDESPYEYEIQGNGTTPCIAPTSQPNTLVLNNITNSNIDGSFTGTTADGYLIIQSLSNTLGANPINGTTYNPGDSIGSGTVIQSGTSTSFSDSGLSSNTTYYYFIYAFNTTNCVGGNTYNTTSPLTNNETTLSGPCLEQSFTSTTFAPTNWLASGVVRDINPAGYNSAPAAVSFNSFNGTLTTETISFPTTLNFYLGRSNNASAKTLNINVSTTSQTGPFTTVQVFDHSNVTAGTYDMYSVDLSAYSTDTNVWVQFEKASSTTSPWRLDDIEVYCGSGCTPTQTITSFSPSTGPVGTSVIINGTGFTSSSTVSINGVFATIVNQTSTELIIKIPNGADTGSLIVNEAGCDENSTMPFTLISTSGSCSSSSFTDLIISEVYDSGTGNGWYMELFNPTSSAIDLDASGSDYELERYADIGNATPSRTIDLTGTIAANSVFVLRIGSASPNPCNAVSFDFTEFNAGINENDEIKLTKNGILFDLVQCPNDVGYSISRNNTASGPSTTFDGTDWTTNNTETCADLGNYSATPSNFPTVTTQPQDVGTCDNSADFSINAVPGNSGTLTYQWYYNNSTASGWTAVTSSSFFLITVNGETTDTLSFNGPVAMISGFQFYCEVTENGTCLTASDASSLKSEFTTWNGTIWDNGAPLITSAAVLNANYNTSVNGSFSACSLVINSTSALTVGDNSYIEITNNISNNGELLVTDKGSVVQISDTATYDDSGSSSANPTIVEKLTAPINNWYEYTYWSSPVEDAIVGTALSQASPGRRFWLEAANYVDTYYENNNDNTQTYGPAVDGVDDNNDIWQLAGSSSIMIPGVGYIASHSIGAMAAGVEEYLYDFRGALNTGDITIAVERNDTELLDYNWNLIGNPYASAVDIDLFFNDNVFGVATDGKIESEIYLWTHTTAPSPTTNGNEQYNFNLLDYATINASGGIAGGDLNNDGVVDALDIPENYIPSCQSFVVKYTQNGSVTSGDVIFKNSMRTTGNNSQFFKTSNTNVSNKFWLNLSSDFNVYNQTLVAYVDEATSGLDTGAYDSKKIGLYKSSIGFYSIVEDNNDIEKLSIQGKNTSDLNSDEVVKLGFKNGITVPTIFTITIDKLQGEFLTNNTIYLKDNYFDTYTNISEGNYSFTSEVGEFTDRFEVVFKIKSKTDIIDYTNNGELTMIELSDGAISFNTNSSEKIKALTIYNTLGQRIYSNKLINTSSHVINLKNLSNAMYIAEVVLDNDSKVIKKGIKR